MATEVRKKKMERNRFLDNQRRGITNTGTTSAGSEVIKVGSVDYTISIVVTLLVLIGVVMVFSASYYTAASYQRYKYDPMYFLKKQGVVAIMGFCAMYFMANFYYKYLRRFAFPVYAAANVLLVAVQFISDETKGAKRWIQIPIFGSFQPSEVAKLGVILLLAFVISNNKNILKTKLGFVACGALIGLTCALVAWGNLSTAIIVAIIGFGIIFVASPQVWIFVIGGLAGAGSVISAIVFFAKDSFRFERIQAWIDPWSVPKDTGYQIIQSLYAVASGGIFGLGLGQSRQKLGFLPESHNDIIFSIICEELGFMGAVLVIILFGILIWRGIQVAINAVDLFGSLVASGIVIMLASQVVINIAVVTNSVPNTGVPLPFISYGGTSLAINMFLVGILLNISRYSKS